MSTKSPALHPQSRGRSRSVKARWRKLRAGTVLKKQDQYEALGKWWNTDLPGRKVLPGETYRRRIPTATVSCKTAGKVKALELKVAKALCKADGLDWKPQASQMTSGNGSDMQEGYLNAARAAMKALGIPIAQRGKRGAE